MLKGWFSFEKKSFNVYPTIVQIGY